jgi:Tol biopolymer transport system component/DNA-binding winged helix-turn-helix (wHTH) protein
VKPSSSVPQTLRFGVFELDPRAGELRKKGMKVRLQGQPVEILAMLLERPGETVTREELQKKLWPADTFVDFEQGLNNAMNRLRAALDDDAESPRFIETLPRRGYRFIGAVNGEGYPEGSGGTSSQPNPTGRQRLLWTIAAGLVVVLAVILLFVVNRRFPPPKITSSIQLTNDGREKDLRLASDGLRVYFSEMVDGHWTVAAVSISGGQAIPIRIPFKDAMFMNLSPDRSELLVGEGGPYDEMPLWRVPILGGSPRRLGSIMGHDAKWSPDGKKLAFTKGGALYLAESDGTEPQEIVHANSDPWLWAWAPNWSPDSSQIRFTLFHIAKLVSALWEVTAAGKSLHPVLPGWQSPPMQNGWGWTADGRYYLVTAWQSMIGLGSGPAADIWTFRDKNSWFGRPNHVPIQLTVGPLHFSSTAPSLDGKTLLAVTLQNRGELMRYDAKNGRLFPYLGGISAQGANFSKDGAWMTYVTFPGGELWRCRPDGSEPLQLTFPPMVTYSPHWSPDGKSIVFMGLQAGGEWQLYLVSADGGPSQRLLPESEKGVDPTWSPDGNAVLFGQILADNKPEGIALKIYNLRTRSLSVVPGSGGLRVPHWSPDGRYISAASATDKRLMLFDFNTQKWTEQARIDAAWLTWSRDSRYIYFLSPEKIIDGVFRVAVGNNKVEKVVSLKGFRSVGTWGASLSLSPEDDPLLLRDVSPPEIYALSWDAP